MDFKEPQRNLYIELMKFLYESPYENMPIIINDVINQHSDQVEVSEVIEIIDKMYSLGYVRAKTIPDNYTSIDKIEDLPEIKLSLTGPGKDEWERLFPNPPKGLEV